eukprot:186890-Lingulodinium_polyedra.AAC.1
MSEEWACAWDGWPRSPPRTEWSRACARAILTKMGMRKVPGIDGLFRLVEDLGGWGGVCPEGLLQPKGSGDAADPLERRPIWLLPMAYRVWAAGRARDMVPRVSTWGAGSPKGSAAELAWELAVELEAAQNAGDAVRRCVGLEQGFRPYPAGVGRSCAPPGRRAGLARGAVRVRVRRGSAPPHRGRSGAGVGPVLRHSAGLRAGGSRLRRARREPRQPPRLR